MKPQWVQILRDLKNGETAWTAQRAKLVDPMQLPSPPGELSHESVTRAISDCFALATQISSRDDISGIYLSTYQQGLEQAAARLKPNVDALQSGGPNAVKALADTLVQMQSSLPWLLPPSLSGSFRKKIQDTAFQGKVDSLDSLINNIQAEFDKAKADASTAETDIADTRTKLATALADATKALETIRSHERESSTAKTTSQGSATSAAAAQNTISELLGKLSNALAEYETLSGKIVELRDEAERALQGASKVGLAAAFARRREQLNTSRRVWLGFFIFGLAFLTGGTAIIMNEILSLMPTASASEYMKLGGHLLLGLPAIWLCWFSVRQYGFTTRVTEDYAFKEAVAMSVAGYAKEVGADPKLLGKLQDSAIDTFAANPLNAVSHHEPATPAHDALNTILGKVEPGKFADLLIAALSKKKD